MKKTNLREKLHRYIETAHDKKIQAIYTMMEEEIEAVSRWENKEFVLEMSRRINDLKAGKVKGYTHKQVQQRAAKALKAVNLR